MASFFQRHVRHNFGLKLVSLILATGLWVAVSRDPVAELALHVPIEFHNMPQDLEITAENIPTVQVRLRGPGRIIHRVLPTDVHAEINLSGIRPGERTFDLSAEEIQRPSGLEVVQVIPSEFRLSLDNRLTRQVEVQPRVIGTFAPGYSIGNVVVQPAAVTISGPQKRVALVESATTDPVDVSGAMTRVSFVRHAYVPDPLIQVMDSNPVRITVIMQKVPAASGGH